MSRLAIVSTGWKHTSSRIPERPEPSSRALRLSSPFPDAWPAIRDYCFARARAYVFHCDRIIE
ncbi:hypothetical protein HK100_010001, partial [Physocladia obscura]